MLPEVVIDSGANTSTKEQMFQACSPYVVYVCIERKTTRKKTTGNDEDTRVQPKNSVEKKTTQGKQKWQQKLQNTYTHNSPISQECAEQHRPQKDCVPSQPPVFLATLQPPPFHHPTPDKVIDT